MFLYQPRGVFFERRAVNSSWRAAPHAGHYSVHIHHLRQALSNFIYNSDQGCLLPFFQAQFRLFAFIPLPVSDHERVQSESCLLKPSSDKMNGYEVCFYLGALSRQATSQACWLLFLAPQTTATTQKMNIQYHFMKDFWIFLFNKDAKMAFSAKASIVIHVALDYDGEGF